MSNWSVMARCGARLSVALGALTFAGLSIMTVTAVTAVPAVAAVAAAAPATPVARPNAAGAVPAAHAPAVLVLGDSLSAEYGLPRDTGWVNLLRQRLAQKRIDYSVTNGSISGDTSSGGLARLPALLARVRPAIVVVELGGNDALRGLPLATTVANLSAIIDMSRAHGARVALIGMQIPPNFGPDYAQQFAAMYATLAARYHVPLVPFLLQGIADKPELFQADQIHPTVAAQPALLDNVWPVLAPLFG